MTYKIESHNVATHNGILCCMCSPLIKLSLRDTGNCPWLDCAMNSSSNAFLKKIALTYVFDKMKYPFRMFVLTKSVNVLYFI